MYNLNNIPNSATSELAAHIFNIINDEVLTDSNIDDWHFHAFNEDYYLIGYYECEQWLKRHNISAFEAINICQSYEKENFGEISGNYTNSEKVVNMLVYIYGEALIYSDNFTSVEELKEAMQELV
jgi:hypothetical protein